LFKPHEKKSGLSIPIFSLFHCQETEKIKKKVLINNYEIEKKEEKIIEKKD